MNTAPILTLTAAAVGYSRQAILSGIDLELRRGSFTGLLGANGSGKSTLLKTILGILRPVAGAVQLHPIDGHTPILGYVPQREALDPVYLLSSFEVVLMGVSGRVGAGRRVNRTERDWARQCLARVDASDLASRLFSELSGGQKQRVLIARALATKPDLLVLDEPISGIDASASRAIMGLLRELHEQQQPTILMVSHDLTTVRQYAREAIWLHQGRLIQGPVSELLSREKIEEVLDLEFH